MEPKGAVRISSDMTEKTHAVKQKIRSYFLNLPAYRDHPFKLDDNDSLMQLGLIDSFGIMELYAFLEEAFKVNVELEDMKRDNFESIVAIYQFIKNKQPGLDGGT
jgi:acyl carrier protein